MLTRISLTISLLLIVNCQLSFELSPILIVPGIASSQLEAKVSGQGYTCNTYMGYFYGSYWLNLMKPPSCVSKALSLQYDSQENRYSNIDGVNVRELDFGRTDSVEYLDELGLIPVYHEFIEYFVNQGYIRSNTIRAAPYDWRHAADEHERSGFYLKVRKLIEVMHFTSGKEKVTIVAHNMGGPMALYFLNNIVSQSWKDQYINAFIPLSGAWSGSNMVLPVLLSGIDSLLPEIPILSNYLKNLSPAFQSFQSMIWLLPNPSVSRDAVLVKTETEQYTANDYKKLFTDAEFPEYHTKHEQVLQINSNFPSPNVPTYCFYGIDVPTPEQFRYDLTLRNLIQVNMGDGDGVVNRISSEVCKQWTSQSDAYYFTSKEFSGVKHVAMLSNKNVLSNIAQVVGI